MNQAGRPAFSQVPNTASRGAVSAQAREHGSRGTEPRGGRGPRTAAQTERFPGTPVPPQRRHDAVLARHVVRGRQHAAEPRTRENPRAGAVGDFVGQVRFAADDQPRGQRVPPPCRAADNQAPDRTGPGPVPEGYSCVGFSLAGER